MKRRDFIAFLGGTAGASVMPRVLLAQQSAMPIIGFLHSGSLDSNAKRVAGFRKGLKDAGLIEGQNVAIEFRWADGRNEKLPELATDLVNRKVAIIVTLSSTVAAVAAKKITSTVPIYFLVAEPPDQIGLVTSLNRPGGNATGITTQAAEVAAKRLQQLHQLVPQALTLSALLQPTRPGMKAVRDSLQATAQQLRVPLEVLSASNDAEIEQVYQKLKPGEPLLIGTDPFFFSRRAQLVALSARYRVPTIYDSREIAEAGGLMSYGPNHVRLWERGAGYVARIIRGQKPADIPVEQAAIFESVINLKTARALGVTVPPAMLALADEVIE